MPLFFIIDPGSIVEYIQKHPLVVVASCGQGYLGVLATFTERVPETVTTQVVENLLQVIRVDAG